MSVLIQYGIGELDTLRISCKIKTSDRQCIYTDGGEVSKIIEGEYTQVIFENLVRDYTYKFQMKSSKGKFINTELKKDYYLR